MYIEYYNIIKDGFTNQVDLFLALTLIVISIILFIKDRSRLKHKILIGIFALISIYFIFSFFFNLGIYNNLRQIIFEKQHSVLEGKIEDFTDYQSRMRPYESFTLQGKEFTYSGDLNKFGFNDVRYLGGPLYPDAEIRVFYYEDLILALWIKE